MWWLDKQSLSAQALAQFGSFLTAADQGVVAVLQHAVMEFNNAKASGVVCMIALQSAVASLVHVAATWED